MATRQKTTPNLNVAAVRGWCLKYIDDGVSAPLRQTTAQKAYEVEKANGNIRTSTFPVGVWVPIFFSLNSGAYSGLGHVAWLKNFGDRVEIRDTEVRTGARSVYTSIDQVLAWFGNFSPKYLGWSYWVDGVQIAEDYTPAQPAPSEKASGNDKGVATVIVSALNVRAEPSTDAKITATYVKGQKFTYDSWFIKNGFVWLSYISYSGVRRYVAEGPYDGNANNVYVSGGIS